MDGMKVISIVGMTGSGKSEVARIFHDSGFAMVRFGDITDEEVRKLGLPLTEENERPVRERIRREHGMAAYAELSVPRIDTALKTSSVVVDGLYSWEEYNFLKDYYREDFVVVAVWASPKTRYSRLAGRKVRPLTPEEAAGRDYAEIENLNKGGPICLSDFTILNDDSREGLRAQVERIITSVK
jgi:dephospho-CoA kinase